MPLKFDAEPKRGQKTLLPLIPIIRVAGSVPVVVMTVSIISVIGSSHAKSPVQPESYQALCRKTDVSAPSNRLADGACTRTGRCANGGTLTSSSDCARPSWR